MPEGEKNIFDLRVLFASLAERKISSILVEGGAGVITSVLKQGLANRVVAIVAPKISGEGLNTVGNLGINDMGKALGLTFEKITRSGDDVILDGRMR